CGLFQRGVRRQHRCIGQVRQGAFYFRQYGREEHRNRCGDNECASGARSARTAREFIMLLGGAAAAWPLTVRAQQPSGMPRFLYFANAFPDEPEARARRAAFREAFEKLGWVDGRNIRIEEHWGTLPSARLRAVAAEFVRSAPNVILTSGSGMSEALQLESRSVPV